MLSLAVVGGCAATAARPEILVVRDPYKLCRVVAFSRCDTGHASPAFIDADDAGALLGVAVLEP